MSSKANYQNYISREGGTKNRVTTEKQVTIFIGDRKQNLNSWFQRLATEKNGEKNFRKKTLF